MSDLLTPKKVAQAIGVSESSVKRWCDDGVIPTQYTAGGHRRIHVSSLVEFLRSSGRQLVAPGIIGLPAELGRQNLSIDNSPGLLLDALLSGNIERCRQITLGLFLAEYNISTICDRVFSVAFAEVGDRWACGEAEVYQERLGCELTMRVLRELRTLLPPTPEDSPVAIGGAAVGDHYGIATTMAELVLLQNHWNAISLGTNVPLKSLGVAIERHQPRLFWLSCSHINDVASFVEAYNSLHQAHGAKVAFVTGGQALDRSIRRQIQCTAHCDTMEQFENFACALRHG
jgi:excisionase family DNA binding protein